MPSFRAFLLASFAVTGVLSADCAGDVTISSSQDVSQLDTCNSWKGNINVGSAVTNLTCPDALQTLNGDMVIDGVTGLTSMSCPKLRSISGTFMMRALTALESFSFDSLTSVGEINWVTLPPKITTLGLTAGIIKCDKLLISDTYLTSIAGINLMSATSFNINNNNYLKSVDVQVANISLALNVESNSKDMSVKFGHLEWAQNISIRDAGPVSFPKLQKVNGSCSLINNTFTDVDLPVLTDVGGSLAFNGNPQLTNVSAPELTDIGGTFQFANNSDLDNINGFPAVATVGGSIDYSGSFRNASLPSLEDVRGGVNVQTTQEFDCSEFKKYKSNGVIKGSEFCQGKLSEARSSNGGASTTGSATNSTQKGDAAHAGVSVAALFAACGAMLVL